jgi:hypothetical protein
VREPVQAYLAPDESALLNRLAEETGLSRAEILRRGIRSYAAEHGMASPMLQFRRDGDEAAWPKGVAVEHDRVLAAAHRAAPKKRR